MRRRADAAGAPTATPAFPSLEAVIVNEWGYSVRVADLVHYITVKK